MAQLISRNPVTGAVVGEFEVDDAAAVAGVVGRARVAANWWAARSFAERRARMRAYAAVLVNRSAELAELVQAENGKSLRDATVEVVISAAHVRWAGDHAERVLRRRPRAPGWLMANVAASVDYRPYGVVGVIGPWNYPVFTPIGSIAYALAAGNSVVFKPSEFTPAVGRWLVEALAQVVPEEPVLSLVVGGGEAGSALTVSDVDKIAFTGSTTTARRVMAACASRLTPLVAECGGKDPMIVADDADVPAAADAALWGGCTNSGQSCVGVERVYVVEAVYEQFLAELGRRARSITAGVDYGAMTTSDQVETVRRHIAEAVARGARAVVGGPEAIRAPFIDPVVLVDVPADAAVLTEETFGPVLAVVRAPDVATAVAQANAADYGLAASVFSAHRGTAIAGQLRAGAVSVNSALAFMGTPALPFGGVGQSGFGRIHGADGLREFARTQSTVRPRVRSPLPVMTFESTAAATSRLVAAARRLYGRSG